MVSPYSRWFLFPVWLLLQTWTPVLWGCWVFFLGVVVVVFKSKSNTPSVDHIPLLRILRVPMSSSCLTLLKHLRFSERSSGTKNSDNILVENEICLKYLLNLSGSSDPGFAQQSLRMQWSMEVHPLTLTINTEEAHVEQYWPNKIHM